MTLIRAGLPILSSEGINEACMFNNCDDALTKRLVGVVGVDRNMFAGFPMVQIRFEHFA
jgi:hypothetical protein